MHEVRSSGGRGVRKPGAHSTGFGETWGVLIAFPNINCVVIENYFPMIELYYHVVTPKEIMALGNDHQWLLLTQKGNNQIQLPNGSTAGSLITSFHLNVDEML